MRIRTFSIAVIIFLGITAATVAASAKTRPTLVLNVPFQFMVGDQLLSPGTYSFAQMLDSSPGLNIVAIRSADGGIYQVAVTTTTQATEPTRSSRLVFNRYGDRYFLSKVWTKGKAWGFLLYPSHTEENLVEKQAASQEVSVLAIPHGAVIAEVLNPSK